MHIEFVVAKHPSGNLTLTRRQEGHSHATDCSGALFGNGDAGSFYRAVAALLAETHREGSTFTYRDAK